MTSNAEIAVDLERRDDGSYIIYAVGRSDAPLSTVAVHIEDFERGTSETHHSGPLIWLSSDGRSGLDDPSVKDQRVTVVHECYDEDAVRQLASLIECPECNAFFSTIVGDESLATDQLAPMDWEQLYDRRLRVWKLWRPEPSTAFTGFRVQLHECDPWPDGGLDIDDWDGPDDPDDGGSHRPVLPPDAPPSGEMSAEREPPL